MGLVVTITRKRKKVIQGLNKQVLFVVPELVDEDDVDEGFGRKRKKFRYLTMEFATKLNLKVASHWKCPVT